MSSPGSQLANQIKSLPSGNIATNFTNLVSGDLTPSATTAGTVYYDVVTNTLKYLTTNAVRTITAT